MFFNRVMDNSTSHAPRRVWDSPYLTWGNKKALFLCQAFPLRSTKTSLQTLSWYKFQNLEIHRVNLVCHVQLRFIHAQEKRAKHANVLAQSGALCLNKHLCRQIRLAKKDNKHRAENPLDVLHLNQTEARTDTHRHPPGKDREVQLP